MIKPLFLVVVVVFVCFECFLILSECRVLQPRSLLNVCAGRLHTFDVSKRVRDLDDSNHDDLVLSSFFNSLAFKWRQQQQRVHTSKRCTYFHISSPRAFLMEKCKSFTAFPLPLLPLHVNIHSFFSSAPHILLSLFPSFLSCMEAQEHKAIAQPTRFRIISFTDSSPIFPSFHLTCKMLS